MDWVRLINDEGEKDEEENPFPIMRRNGCLGSLGAEH